MNFDSNISTLTLRWLPCCSCYCHFGVFVEYWTDCDRKEGKNQSQKWRSITRSFFVQISPLSAFKEELSFAFNFWIMTKPVHAHSTDDSQSRKQSVEKSFSARSRRSSESKSLNNKSFQSLRYNGSRNYFSSKSLINLNWSQNFDEHLSLLRDSIVAVNFLRIFLD